MNSLTGVRCFGLLCRGLCAVQTADGWFAAVRHIGSLFGLKPNEDIFDSCSLPYPDLSLTISSIQMEPAENIWEHYSAPGAAEKLVAKAKEKQQR